MKYKIIEHGKILSVFWIGKLKDAPIPASSGDVYPERLEDLCVIYDGLGKYPGWNFLNEDRRLATPLDELL